MHHLDHEIDRNQLSIIALEEMVAKDSFARLVDLFVEALALEDLGFMHVRHEQEGRPPYHPKILLKLYMYGYRHGLRSSTKLHQSCLVNIEVWWLLKGLKPSARTICYFRKNNAAAFKKAFQHFVLLLKEWKLIDGQTIAIDSFKIRAVNSLKNNFNQSKIDRHIDYIDEKIQEYQNQLDLEDDPLTRSKIEAKIDYQQGKKDNYLHLEKQLHESGQSQLSTNDPDARGVILHRNIVNVGYNVQAGCDSKHKLFINAQTGSVNDTHALADMAIEAKELLQVQTMDTLTDKGYTTGEELDKCDKHGITTYSAPKDNSSPDNGRYSNKAFAYDEIQDTYTCPQGKILTTNGRYYKKNNGLVKHYKNGKACRYCPLKNMCTTNKSGRLIERSKHQKAIDENEARVNSRPDYYRLRQQITEHQFGTLKRQWGFTYTLMKGKENVLSEVYLCFSTYNLLRCIKILGIDVLKSRLKSLISSFFALLTALNRISSLCETVIASYRYHIHQKFKAKYQLLTSF